MSYPRIICVNPEHVEKTPSMVIYEDHVHCHACGYHITLDKLNRPDIVSPVRRPPEDLKSSLERIKALPCAPVRGLSLPTDGKHYYIVFPSGDYYKRRKFIDDGEGPKYRCPAGHRKPLYIPRLVPKVQALAIVEGEINALSLASLEPAFSVCSPGGAADFFGVNFDKNSRFFLTHSAFLIIVDKDQAGVEAAIKIKERLLRHTPRVFIHAMAEDCNELLMRGRLGERVKGWEAEMGMRTRVRPSGMVKASQPAVPAPGSAATGGKEGVLG